MVAGYGGVWAAAALQRLARTAAYKASQVVGQKLAAVVRPVNTALKPALARAPRTRQPIHPAALLRQQKSGRWHSTSAYKNINAAVRRFMSTGRLDAAVPRADRAKFHNTKTSRAIAQMTGRAPFASTLRPNLTGGALPRTAGGYSLGSGRIGGARFFSHTPAAQAQVMQNVSAAVRAFWISGSKAQYDGLTARGERRYRAVSALQEEATRMLAAAPRNNAPGAFVDFTISPTVTALSPLAGGFPFTAAGTKVASVGAPTLHTEGFLDVLSVDFDHALKDLAATLADIKKLATLGDLPIRLEKGHVIRVRFPGVDAGTVESLMDDLGLTRSVVGEDPEFNQATGVPMALKFPFAPGAEDAESRVLTSPGGSLRSLGSFPVEHELFDEFSDLEENPWLASADPEGYESMSPPISSGEHCSEDFEGAEGVYRFIEECDRARGMF
jgi:hypothetical protein